MKHTTNEREVINYHVKAAGRHRQGLNCRHLTSFDRQMKYEFEVFVILILQSVVTIHSIHGILTGRSDGNECGGRGGRERF